MMNDNEIIKALECCGIKHCCEECPYKGVKCKLMNGVLSDALDLLKRQQAEKEALIAGQETMSKYIEEQQAEIERLSTLAKLGNMRANDYRLMRDRALEAEREAKALRELLGKECDICIANREAEAIKEFAERLKETIEDYQYVIDNLVKEMVGDTE